MLDDVQSSLRAHLPGGSYLLFVLIAGVMAGLAVWSLISSPRNRAAAEDRDLRGQLQTELRSLVGAPVLPPASSSRPQQGTPLDSEATHISWKWIAFILLIGVAITLWATLNYYAASTMELEDEEAVAEEPARPPLVVIPDWLKVAVRSSRDGVMSLDARGRIMTANPAAESILGFESGRLPGQKVFDFLPDLGEGPDGLRRFSQVESATVAKATVKDGSSKGIRLALHRVNEKGDSQYVAMFFAEEPAAAAVAQPIVAAEPEAPVVAPAAAPVGERQPPAEVPSAVAQLTLAPGMVNEDALHDLENQVVMLGGYSELVVAALEQEHPARPDAEAVSRSAARANLLCHEVAPIAQVHPRLLDLNEFVIAVAGPLSRVLDEGCEVKGFRGQTAAEVWADPDLLERALCSLAWRTQELAGGLSRISVAVTNGRLDFRMVPMGKPDAATAAAFDALQAVDWIERQNGTIEMEERSEAGVRFRIWLPAAAQSRQQRVQVPGEAAGSQSHAAD